MLNLTQVYGHPPAVPSLRPPHRNNPIWRSDFQGAKRASILFTPSLEDMINEISQHERTNTTWFHLYEVSKEVKFIEAESRRIATRESGCGCGWGEFQLCQPKRILEMKSGDGCITMWKYSTPPNYTLNNVEDGQSYVLGDFIINKWKKSCILTFPTFMHLKYWDKILGYFVPPSYKFMPFFSNPNWFQLWFSSILGLWANYPHC